MGKPPPQGNSAGTSIGMQFNQAIALENRSAKKREVLEEHLPEEQPELKFRTRTSIPGSWSGIRR